MHRRITQAAAVVMMSALFITGCTSQASNIGMAKGKTDNVVDTGFSVSTVGSYDSADTAVVLSVDSQNNAVTFMNLDAGRQYTLYYDGTTYVQDKYNGPMAISQIKSGDVVDVNFLKGKRQIASMQLSPSSWVYDSIGNYNLGGINKTASIGSSTYSLPDEVVVFSNGKRAEVMDIVSQDVISVRGVGHKIYSINVDKGHGYVRLKNDQALIGGWIEVGNAVIREISEDMLLVVPEGSYQVFLSNNGASCVKDVIIERDKEVVLDVGDLEVVQDKTGMILLSVTPEDATVKIDGKEVDISSAIELPYGIHQVRLEAEGYDSLTKYIQVGSEYAKISFALEEKKERNDDDSTISQNDLEEEEEDDDDDSSISENTISATSSNRVYIDAPENVEVYLDSNYIGISPVSFKKKVGSHTITLRKNGYVTKSYTIYLYDDGEDITYSFTDLEKETSNNNNSTNSGSGSSATSSKSSTNTVSGNESSSTNSSKNSSDSSSSKDSTSSDSSKSPGEDGDADTGDGDTGDSEDNSNKDNDSGDDTSGGDIGNSEDDDKKDDDGGDDTEDGDTGDSDDDGKKDDDNGDDTEDGDTSEKDDGSINDNSIISMLFRKKR